MELLVVIAIITVLMSVLMPVLSRVKEQSGAVKCRANIRAVYAAVCSYSGGYDNYYPSAYYYNGLTLQGAKQYPVKPLDGYRHFSDIISEGDYIAHQAFQCPQLKKGGLPPANTVSSNLESGQRAEVEGVVDRQALRNAFAVNEALFPGYCYMKGFNNADRASRFVRSTEIVQPASTICLTEMTGMWKRADINNDGVCRSYMPVHAFMALGASLKEKFNLNMAGGNSGGNRPCFEYGPYTRVTVDMLPSDAQRYQAASRLNLVGSNHRLGSDKTANFVYADGHIENKTLRQTIETFQWGKKVYSVKGDNRVALP